MRTVSDIVEQVVTRSPYLSELLSDGLSNNASVARRIQPDVEQMLMEKVSLGAISMALHRLEKSLQEPMYGTRFLRQITGITVRSNLVQFVCANFTDISDALDEMFRIGKERKDAFLNFSRGLHESTLIVSTDLLEAAEAVLKGKEHIRKIEGLSAITLQLPDSCLNVPGVYYPFLKAIAQEGISLVEAMSVRTEFSIILADKDVERGFAAIKRVTSAT